MGVTTKELSKSSEHWAKLNIDREIAYAKIMAYTDLFLSAAPSLTRRAGFAVRHYMSRAMQDRTLAELTVWADNESHVGFLVAKALKGYDAWMKRKGFEDKD